MRETVEAASSEMNSRPGPSVLDRIQVVDLIPRQDLERKIKTLM